MAEQEQPRSVPPRADLLAGLLFAAIGAVDCVGRAPTIHSASASRIGPGYVPRLLGILLAGIGLFLIVRSWWTTEAIDAAIAWRPLLLILAGVVAFALVFEASGLVPAILVSVAVAQLRHAREPLDHGDRARRHARLFRLGAVRQGPGAAATGLVPVSELLTEPDLSASASP